MFNDRSQLFIQPCADNFGKRFAVNLFGTVPCDFLQLFLSALNGRSKGSERNRTNILHHIGNQIGVGDYHLKSLFPSQIGKFLQHFIRRAQIQRSLLVSVAEFHPRHQYRAEYSISGIEKMHVAGRHNRLVQRFSQLNHRFIKLFDSFKILCDSFSNHVFIILKGLDFQIIIKRSDVAKLRPFFPRNNRLIQFSGFTGASDNQPFPMFYQLAFGNAGTFEIIF